jgi:hypothetical protein
MRDATLAVAVVASLVAGRPAAAQVTPLTPPTILDVPAAPRESDAARPLALRLSASAVTLGLGDAGLLSADADALFYNPAMLTTARGIAASGQRYGSTASSGAFASVQALGSTSIGLGARVVDWSGSAPTYGEALASGRDALTQSGDVRGESAAFTAGAARTVGPVRVGVAATYARESYGAEFDEELLVDVGAVLPFGPGNALGLALAVQHVGAGLDLVGAGQPAPWRAVAGVGGRSFPLATFWDLSAITQVAVDADGAVSAAGGAELAWVPLEGVSVAFRLGARHGRDDQRPLTGGLGLSLDRWSLDYALEPFRGGVTAHRIGLRIR